MINDQTMKSIVNQIEAAEKNKEINPSAEIAFTQFINSSVEWDDPYWQLFEIKDTMNTFILKAVEYGYKKGYDEGLKVKETPFHNYFCYRKYEEVKDWLVHIYNIRPLKEPTQGKGHGVDMLLSIEGARKSDKTKLDMIEPFVSKMNGWANFKAFLEREIK